MKMLLIVAVYLTLQGTVPDKGFVIINNKIQSQPGSDLLLTQNGEKITIKAK